jgi:ribosomal protein L21
VLFGGLKREERGKKIIDGKKKRRKEEKKKRGGRDARIKACYPTFSYQWTGV